MPAPTEAQVREFVANLGHRVHDLHAVGIRADSWAGPPQLDVNGRPFRVALCHSPLHVREELIQAAGNGGLIVLTPVAESDLGADVLARLAKRRVLDIDPWRLALDLFRATAPDPRLTKHVWLAEALVECAPPGKYPAVAAGVLDGETIWSELQGRLLALAETRPDALALVRWAETTGAAGRYLALAPRLRDDFRERIRETAGPAGVAMLDAIELAPATDLVALGLACHVLFDDAGDQALRDAAVRFERFHRQGALPREAGRQWADAAGRVLRDIEVEQGPAKARVRAEPADRLLIDLGAETFLHLSPTSPAGFDQRLASFGRLLERAASATSSLQDAEQAGRHVLGHRLARSQEARARRVEMAMRLARWLHREVPPPASSLVEAAASYGREGAFVDLARLALLGGDHPPMLGRAYSTLLDRAREKREQENARFGELLGAAGAAPPADQRALMPVEQVLERVVAPVAKDAPVLFLVMDGLSRPVYCELLEDLIDQGCRIWKPDCPELAHAGWAALAAVPSVTEVSRTSLFSGTLSAGDAGDERKAFAAHPALSQVSRSARPPVLFHKAALAEASGRGLADDVKRAIASSDQRVVGVVLNVVDDLLFKGDQVQPRWTLEAAPLLRALVDAARAAARVVILTSDHGHLLDDDSAFQGREAGERWREDAGPPAAGEVRIEGRRVRGKGQASVIVPWSERTRYVGKRNGYHGGATPQEMVLPLALLSWTDDPVAGFVDAPFAPPEWWYEAVAQPAVATPAPRPAAPRPAPSRPLLEVLEPAPAAMPDPGATPIGEPAWLASLFKADRYAEQRKLSSGRGLPSDDEVRRLLGALAERGGKMTRVALAQRLVLRPDRLAPLVAATRRLLNVDGLRVLDFHGASDTVELNVTLLVKQFELPPS